MKTFDIVIPHFNNPRLNALALACLQSIRIHSSDYRLIWIQNGGDVPREIRIELARCEESNVIANAINIGFVKASNQGMRSSDAPFVVLMNNDTEAAPGWLQKLQKPLLDGYSISGPLSSAGRSWQGSWKVRSKDVVEVPKDRTLAFFCTMIKREVLARIGYLDEAFGLGLGDDDDYCYRARAVGLKLALVQDLRIKHQHRSTFRTILSLSQIASIQQKAAARLKAKGYLA